MAVRSTLRNVVKGLRFRLTIGYLLLFALLLAGVGFLFRETVRVELDNETKGALEEEWGAAKGYLKIEKGKPVWIADSTDPEEAYIVERLRHAYMLADSSGRVLENSATYESIGIDDPQEIARILSRRQPDYRVRRDRAGVPYLVKSGAMQGGGKTFYFSMGRSLEANQRTVNRVTQRYLVTVYAVIALASILGWFLSGRAIQPVNSVAKAAREITSSNLSLRIPRREANDELDHLIDNFNHMTERLERSFDQIRRFSTDVSHELRTPLTVVRGQLEVALFTAETPAQYRDAMVNALEDVEKLSSIVRALLLLSQAESGQLVLQKNPTDLSLIAADIVDQFQIPAEEARVSLVAASVPETMILADRTQMERLLSNLLSNAVKYTHPGGKIQVRVGPAPEIGWIHLVVEDTGKGIAAENLPHIFNRFYRVKDAETHQVQGLGLGLSFAAWIVSAHGGTILAESEPGSWTRFTVRLPSHELSAQAVAAAERPTASVAG